MKDAPRPRMSGDARRQQLLAAARAAFIEFGYAGARTKDIAESTGVTEAMVYRYFGTKERLFEEAVALPMEKAVAHAAQFSGARERRSGEDGVAFVKELSRDFFRDLLIAMREIAPLLGVALFTDGKRGAGYYQDRIAPIFDRLRSIVAENLPTWDHRDFDIDLAVRFAFGMCLMVAIDERFDRTDDYSPESVASEIVEFIYDGLRAR